MIEDAGLMKSMTGVEPKSPNYSAFTIECNSAAEVDQCVARVKAAGFEVVKEPWDAFWGQRYASLAELDGSTVDVFAWV
jgi:uncharacterized glyoxalase superfamily protein PhnB